MNKEMTVTGLKRLKSQMEAAWSEYRLLNEKLKKLCHCPHSTMKTRSGYETDTLGNNGTTWYQDYCGICGKCHGESYGGVYSNYSGGPKFPEVKK